jgi:hypothetical protein
MTHHPDWSRVGPQLLEALEEFGVAVHNCFRGGPPPDALVKLHEASTKARAAIAATKGQPT